MVAEPVTAGIGVTAGALAFAETAFAATKFLYNQFESIKSHKDTVNSFLNELGSLQKTLLSILSILRLDAPRPLTQRDETLVRLLKGPLENCAETCNALAIGLKRSKISDSDNKGDYFKKWLKQDFRSKKTEEAWKQLQSHKNTLGVALEIISIKDGEITHDKLEDLKGLIAETIENIKDEELPRVVDRISHLIHVKADEQAQQMKVYQVGLEAELQLLRQASEAAASIQPSSRTIEANLVDERSGQFLDAGPTGIYRNVLVKDNKSTRESMQYIGDMSQYKPEMMGHMARPGVVHVAPPAEFSVTPGPPADVNIVGINIPGIYPTAGPARVTTAPRVNEPPVPRIEASRLSEDDALLRDIRTSSAARAGQPAEEAAMAVRPRSQEPTEATQGAEIGES